MGVCRTWREEKGLGRACRAPAARGMARARSPPSAVFPPISFLPGRWTPRATAPPATGWPSTTSAPASSTRRSTTGWRAPTQTASGGRPAATRIVLTAAAAAAGCCVGMWVLGGEGGEMQPECARPAPPRHWLSPPSSLSLPVVFLWLALQGELQGHPLGEGAARDVGALLLPGADHGVHPRREDQPG